MANVWLLSILSVIAVSLVSFIGLATISIKKDSLHTFLIYFVSFAAGALLGDAFLHLLPEIVQEIGFTFAVSIYILLGIIILFMIEGVIQWRHCHHPHHGDHIHAFAWMNLVGDGFHNFMDGIIIGASYLISVPVGIATTLAVILHEIPQEIGDFAVLIRGGFTRKRALMLNFLVAIVSVFGVILALTLDAYISNVTHILVPLAVGGFIYIAGADLIPELHKEEKNTVTSLLVLGSFIAGIGVMAALLLVG